MYEGFDAELQRPVAIKVLHAARMNAADGHEAFVKEPVSLPDCSIRESSPYSMPA